MKSILVCLVLFVQANSEVLSQEIDTIINEQRHHGDSFLKAIKFVHGQAKLEKGELVKLEHVAKFLNQYLELDIHILSGTDSLEWIRGGIKLADKRGQAIKKKLIELGVKADRIDLGTRKERPIGVPPGWDEFLRQSELSLTERRKK
jgi:outer membrane protein OmpA-like peptidoglycan-associated protein